MADRANIAIHFGQKQAGDTITGEPVMVDQRVYLYSHSKGAFLALVLRDTIRGRGAEHLSDDQAFTRILFEEVVGDDHQVDAHVYGLSPFVCDNEHPVLVVDCTNERVWAEDRTGEPIEGREWAIQAFGDLDNEAALAAMED